MKEIEGIFSRPYIYLGFSLGMLLSRLIREWGGMSVDWRASTLIALVALAIGTVLVLRLPNEVKQ